MTMSSRSGFWALAAIVFVATAPLGVRAEEPVKIAEAFPVGHQCHVSCRVEVKGTLAPEPDKGKKEAKPLTLIGESVIEYDERVLAAKNTGEVDKTLRIYRRIDFQRKVGDREQQQTIRPTVRRLVLLRHKHNEVPFSPDGPLTWGEIDLVRTDVFTPALAGLFPPQAVRPGESWTATPSAVQELTDMERIDEGHVDCKLEEVTPLTSGGQARRQARVSLSGTVRGLNEDGPNRQQLDGFFYFDLESNHLSYLSLKGVHTLLDKGGKEVGKIEGRFVLTRQTQQRSKDLSDEAIKSLVLEPNADNTLLLYDNPTLGLRFLHPRRWRIASENGPQVALDAADGSGLLLTVESLAGVPTAAQLQKESREFLSKQKAKILRDEPVKSFQANNGQLERFALEVELGGQKALMDYIVIRQQAGGITLAARLLPTDLTALRGEVERIARSIVVSPRK
jgi:hypothetical protein